MAGFQLSFKSPTDDLKNGMELHFEFAKSVRKSLKYIYM